MLATLTELASTWWRTAVPYGVQQLYLAPSASCLASENPPSFGVAILIDMLQYYGELANAAFLLAYMHGAISGRPGVALVDKGPKLRAEIIRCVNEVAKAYDRSVALEKCISTS